MLSDLYSEKLLDAAGSIPPARRLDAPDGSAVKTSRVCGSEVAVDVKVVDGVVTDFAMEARACALGQASASIFARNVIGASVAEVFAVRDGMRAMLKDGAPPPPMFRQEGRWADLAALKPIADYPQRHASTLLVFEAVVAALVEAGAAPPENR